MSFPDIHTEIPQRVHRKNDCNKPLPWQIAKRDDRRKRKDPQHKAKRGNKGTEFTRWLLFEGTSNLDMVNTMLEKESAPVPTVPPRFRSQRFVVTDSENGQEVVGSWDSGEAHKWAVSLGLKFHRMFYVEVVEVTNNGR